MNALFDLPHATARALASSGAPVYLSINPAEFHGPHLSLHTDALISAGLMRALHARRAARAKAVGREVEPLLVGGELPIGVDPTRGPGSRHAPFRVARQVIVEACEAIARLGARRVVLMTFHGAPLHNLAIEAGVERLRALGIDVVAPFNRVLRELLELDAHRFAAAFAHVEDPIERQRMMADLGDDFHAGFFETSIALHLAPESVSADFRSVPPCPAVTPHRSLLWAARAAKGARRDELAKELDFAARAYGWTRLRPFPGYTGRPHRASAEAGAVFAEAIVDEFDQTMTEVFERGAPSPSPVLRWTHAATLGGLIRGA